MYRWGRAARRPGGAAPAPSTPTPAAPAPPAPRLSSPPSHCTTGNQKKNKYSFYCFELCRRHCVIRCMNLKRNRFCYYSVKLHIWIYILWKTNEKSVQGNQNNNNYRVKKNKRRQHSIYLRAKRARNNRPVWRFSLITTRCTIFIWTHIKSLS